MVIRKFKEWIIFGTQKQTMSIGADYHKESWLFINHTDGCEVYVLYT